jgi:hypothetical protein
MTTEGNTTRQIAFRLTEGLLSRLDRLAKRLSGERPGLRVTRTDVVRMLLTRGLDEAEGREERS